MGRIYNSKQLNLLEGKILPKVIIFVVPLMLTNLLQTFYNAADMVIVGLSGVEGAVGSIGTTSALINLIINLSIGFSVGTNIVVAKCIGKGERSETETAVHTSIGISIIFGTFCMIIGLFACRPALKFMGDEGFVLDLASKYAFYYFLGTPFLSVSNNLIAIFRAKGDTKTPLFVLSFTGLLNIGLNLFFVLVCGLSVEGVAIATSVSNCASAFILLYILSKDHGWCKFSFSKLRITKASTVEILKVGIPASIQGSLFSISNVIIQSSVISINNTLCPGGSAVIDGNAASGSIETFVYTATNSVYSAAVTFTSQHYGARMYRRIGDVMRNCYFVTFMIAIIGSAVVLTFKKVLVGLYVDDSLALQTAYTRLYIMIIPYFTLAFMEVGSGILRGLGKSLTSTVVSLVGSCVLRVVWIYTVFQIKPTLTVVYLSYPISWTLTAIVHFICSMSVRRSLIKKHPEKSEKIRKNSGRKSVDKLNRL